MHQFLATNGVKHIRSAPYHPSTNGAVERLVQTVKHALIRTSTGSSIGADPGNFSVAVSHNTTCHYRCWCTGLTVAGLSEEVSRPTQLQQRVCNMREGPHWAPWTVVERLGPISYLICVHDQELWRRHVDHIRDGVELPHSTESSPSQEDGAFLSVPFPSTSEVTSEPEDSNTTPSDREPDVQNSSSTEKTEPRYPSRVRRAPIVSCRYWEQLC